MIDDEHTDDGRGPDGKFPKGVSGNPGGIPKSARKLRKLSRFAAGKAIEALTNRVVQACDEPMKLVELPDGTQQLQPNMADKDLVTAARVLAEYGGYTTSEVNAKLMIAAAGARSHFDTEEEFLRFVAVTLGKPVDLVRGPSDQKQITAGLTQLEETTPCKRGDEGSNPSSGSIDESE